MPVFLSKVAVDDVPGAVEAAVHIVFARVLSTGCCSEALCPQTNEYVVM